MSAEMLRVPGFVDIHTHCREPSTNKSETFHHATRVAVKNGFVFLGDMPNNPGHETWWLERVLEKHGIIMSDAYIPVGTWGGSQPTERCDNIGELAKMAPYCIGLKSYATKTTENDIEYSAEDFRERHTEWRRVTPKPIGLHAGADNLVEFIDLAEELDYHLHVCHVNSPLDVEMIYQAKKRGQKITCGVCPHYLLKDSHDVLTEGWWARMKPPLATQVDAEKLMFQFNERKIDILETDHAPYPEAAKWKAQANNPDGEEELDTCYGVPSLEVANQLILRQVVLGNIALNTYVEATSTLPAQIIGAEVSKRTSVTWKMVEKRITDRNLSVRAETLPFLGMLGVGEVDRVVINGKLVMRSGQWLDRRPRVIVGNGERI